MKRTHPVFRATAIAMALLTNACYSYTSTDVRPGLTPDTQVSLELTSRAMAENQIRLGADVERVVGTVARATTDSIELRVLRTLARDGAWTIWSGEPVAFSSNDFARVGERRFSRGRTAIAVGGLLVAVVLALTTDLIGFGDSNSGSDPRPIPPVNPG
jgi:hypothetical protein